jgi:hypothetical protein
MNPAPLPGRAQDPADRRLQTLMRVRDHQLGAAKASADEALQERRPEDLCLGWSDVQPNYFPFTLGAHRHSDYHRDRPDLTAFTLLEVGRIEPQIRPIARERALEKGGHPVVDILAQLAHRAFADPREPHGLHQFVDAPPIQASWMTATNAFSDVFRGSRNGGK